MTKKTILIADDEDSLRTLVLATLEDSGYELLEASDGDEALALARTNKPDLLVLDWMMPGLTGVEVTAQIRRDEEPGFNVPIVLLTAKSQQDDVAVAVKSGVTHFLTKPFSPSELHRLVAGLLEQAETDDVQPEGEARR